MLKDQYEYIIVIDSEAQFISKRDLYRICIEFFQNKTLYGNILRNPSWDVMQLVIQRCAKYVDKMATCPLYLWWNNLPIYKTNTLSSFFRRTKIGKKLPCLTYYDYDYYIYMFYLLKYEHFSVVDLNVKADFSMAEVLSHNEYESISTLNAQGKIYMATQFAIGNFDLNNAFLKTHIDREDMRKKSRVRKLVSGMQAYRKIRRMIS